MGFLEIALRYGVSYFGNRLLLRGVNGAMIGSGANEGRAFLAVIAHVAGRGAGKLRLVGGGASGLGPLAGGTAITALWAAVYGWANLRKCRKGDISRKEAAQRTAAESIGIGLATGAGIAALNVARTLGAIAAPAALVPFVVGTAVTGGANALWQCKVSRRFSDSDGGIVGESGVRAANPATAPRARGPST